MARRILPSLCPLLWDVEPTVRESAFDVVQSLLNRIFAGHQEWTKTGVEPKAPVNPPPQPTSVIGVTGSYVSSAINWVSGSLLSKNDTTTTKTAEDKNEPPKAVSSSNVNRVLSPTVNMEVSMEELEALGSGASVEGMWEAKELGELITVFVENLNERQRYLFVDRYYLAESIEKTAADLSISTQVAYKELRKIKQGLKEYLERNGVQV